MHKLSTYKSEHIQKNMEIKSFQKSQIHLIYGITFISRWVSLFFFFALSYNASWMMATENQQKVANLSTRNTIGEKKQKKQKKNQKNKNNTTPEDIY